VVEWTDLGDLMIVCRTEGVTPNESWDAFMKDMKTKPIAECSSLSIIGAGELTSVQRTTATEILKKRGIIMAVVRDEQLVRGMVTAASWMGAKIKAFSWTGLDDALDYLKVSPEMADRVKGIVNSLRRACTDEYESVNKVRVARGGR